MASDMSGTKVCIIGCGPSGMMALCAFSAAKSRGEIIPEVTCFEKQSKISGLWNYTWRTGLTAEGDALPNSMYQHLWTNGPKECLELPDYTFMDHFKKLIPSFPPRAVLQDYLLGKAKKYNIEEFVKLQHVVRNVEERGDQFLVTYEDVTTNKIFTKVFDYVICATGYYNVPNFPEYPGFNEFRGRAIHSHDFRNPEEFKDKVVFIVGSSKSAEDISLQLYKYGAKKCIISYHNKPMNFKWPEQIIEKPPLLKVADGNKFHFSDGTVEEADDVIFCTGYQHHFAFMSQNIRLFTTNIMYPKHLYKGVMFHKNERCLYIGMQNQYYTFTMFDTQALWICDYIMGKIQIPDVANRSEHMKHWHERGQNLKDAYEEIDFQRDYVIDLVKDLPTYPKHHDIKLIADHWKYWERSRKANIMTYREECYISPNNGQLATKPKRSWIENYDDSIAGFVNDDTENS